MALYVDVNIFATENGLVQLKPDPCVVNRSASGIQFWNWAPSQVTIDMPRVPGFERVIGLAVPSNGYALALADLATERAGIWQYTVTLGKTLRGPGDSPRVILDI